MAGHGSGPSTNTSTIPELYIFNRTVSRDQSITFSPYILFLAILFPDLLCARVCSEFQHFAQSLATMHPTVKNIGNEKTLANYCISLSFLPMFTISYANEFQSVKVFSTKLPTVQSLFVKLFCPLSFFCTAYIYIYSQLLNSRGEANMPA